MKSFSSSPQGENSDRYTRFPTIIVKKIILTIHFLVGSFIGQTDDPAVEKGEISPFALSFELIHCTFARAGVAEFKSRTRMGTFESERSKTLDEKGFTLNDANKMIESIKYGDSRTNIRKSFVHFDVTVDNEKGIAASEFRHLDQPAAVKYLKRIITN